MPELPEVETLKRELGRAVIGREIKEVEIHWPKLVAPLSVAEFQKRLRGRRITAVERRAKVLIITLTGDLYLLIHLKLTGQLIFIPRGGKENLPNQFTRAIFRFSDGSRLFFNDLRKFGWCRLVDSEQLKNLLKNIGPEPLQKDFNFTFFDQLLDRYPRRKIKQLLMDQVLIAGLGNIYSAEACFAAKILPTRTAKSLGLVARRNLYQKILKVLKLAIKKKGTSADTYVQLDGTPGGFVPYLRVYGRGGEKCKVCGALIKKIKLNGRGTHFCPSCQK